MDQVKVYLGVAKKHHFWILAGLVVITSLAVWLKASSALLAKYEADKKTITDAEASVLKANAPGEDGYLPNQTFAAKVDTLHEGLKQQVAGAWQTLYERQAALFTWPLLETQDGPIDLNRFKPDEEITEYLRTFYNENIVREQWTELLEEAHIRTPKVRTVADAEEADLGDAEKRGVEYEGLVVWSPERRNAIISRYYTANATPSTTRLRLTQEDVWLFESLIEVVNTVNAGATDSLKAPIKEIDTLDVAQWAIAASLQSGSPLWKPGEKTGAGMGMPGGMAGGAMPGMAADAMAGMNANAGAGGAPGAPGAAGAGAATAVDPDTQWLEGRYLDEKGQPLKAGAAHPFAEFRQVFVYMKFIMDQRRIPDLVAACANARLPIETRQIRVQMLKSDSGSGAGSSGGGMFPAGGGMLGGMGGMPGGMGGMPAGMGGMPDGMGGYDGGAMPPMGMDPMAGGGAGGFGPAGFGGGGFGGAGFGASGYGGMAGGVETTVFDAIVELSGVIYLYNPPDPAKLGTGAAGSPEKRSFGVPTTAVRVPGAAGGMGGMGGYDPMGGGTGPAGMPAGMPGMPAGMGMQ